jgi:hypothetical protein
MGLYPALPITACFAWFALFGAHALRMRTDKNYREAWGSATLSLLAPDLFWLWVVIGGEPEMLKRTMLLMPAGAIVGACFFAYLGYVVSDFRAAKAQEGGLPKKGDILGGIGFGMPSSGEMPKAGDTLGGIGAGIPNSGPAQPAALPPSPGGTSGGTTNYSIGEIHDNHGIIQQGPNNTVNLAPKPELRGIQFDQVANPDGTFTRRYLVEWTAEFPGDWRIEAYGNGVLGVSTSAQQFGHSGVRDDRAFASVNRPNGRYTIFVQTKTNTSVELKHTLIR